MSPQECIWLMAYNRVQLDHLKLLILMVVDLSWKILCSLEGKETSLLQEKGVWKAVAARERFYVVSRALVLDLSQGVQTFTKEWCLVGGGKLLDNWKSFSTLVDTYAKKENLSWIWGEFHREFTCNWGGRAHPTSTVRSFSVLFTFSLLTWASWQLFRWVTIK